tara:strand:- start:517 stop:2190 length:1674 start_codon:yes stop_codon:yes gene_type:complete
MAEVTVNIKANTGQATNEVEDLNSALNETERSSEDLSASLAHQEARIKTLDGAINLIGGSVELLAGGLALSGAVTEEQAEQFQTAAIGAIAFADGTKRVLDGYRSLNEGLAAYGGVAGKARALTASLNKAILANPYVAAAVAVVAITAAIYGLVKSYKSVITDEQRRAGALAQLNRETESAALLQEQYNRSLEIEDNNASNRIKLLKAQGASIGEIFQAEKALLQTRIAAQKLEIIPELERQNVELEKVARALEAARKANNGNIVSQEATLEILEANRDALKDQVIELDNLNTELLILDTNYTAARQAIEGSPIELKVKLTTPGGEEKEETLAEYFARMNGDIQGGVILAQSSIQSIGDSTAQSTVAAYANSALAFQAFLIDTNNSLNDFYSGSTAEAISATLSTATMFANTLAEVQDNGSEQAFESSKKYKIAAVVTSAIQSAFEAFGAAQQFGPILGPILGAAQVGIIAAASNKAIGDIRSSTFGGSSTPNLGSIGGSGTPMSAAGGMGGSRQTLVTGVPTPETGPMRAYVVTGDVTSGQEAEAQLNTRRTFGPG